MLNNTSLQLTPGIKSFNTSNNFSKFYILKAAIYAIANVDQWHQCLTVSNLISNKFYAAIFIKDSRLESWKILYSEFDAL